LQVLRGTVVAQLAQRAVPKFYPAFDAAARSLQSPLAPMRRVRDQIIQQLTTLGAMTVAIQFDVPVDVVDEITDLIIVVPRQPLSDDLFSADSKQSTREIECRVAAHDQEPGDRAAHGANAQSKTCGTWGRWESVRSLF
jgi:hypothetical protein